MLLSLVGRREQAAGGASCQHTRATHCCPDRLPAWLLASLQAFSLPVAKAKSMEKLLESVAPKDKSGKPVLVSVQNDLEEFRNGIGYIFGKDTKVWKPVGEPPCAGLGHAAAPAAGSVPAALALL